MLVKKSTYEKRIRELELETDHLSAINEDLSYTLDEKDQKIEELEKQIQAFENGVSDAEANQTSASFYVSDDLQEVKPVTRVSPSIINKLVEVGYLSSNKRNDEFSLNLAVLVLVSEALEQIVFSFEQEVEDDDYQDELEQYKEIRGE